MFRRASLAQALFWGGAIVGLALARTSGFLLYHALAELFAVVVAASTFVVAWNGRRYLRTGHLLWIGVAYLPVAVLDVLHTLAYSGMGVFPEAGVDLATQLWVAARSVEAVSLLLATLWIRRPLSSSALLVGYGVVLVAILVAIFPLEIFPTAYDDSAGRLTPFKVLAEYAVVAVLITAVVVALRERDRFDRKVLVLWVASIATTALAELAFTLYVDPHGLTNELGHLLKLVSFFLIYKAVVETGLARPTELLFRELKESEAALRQSEAQHRSLVDLSPEAIVVQRGGLVLLANTAAARLLGAESPAEVVGKRFVDLVAPETRGEIDALLVRLEGGGGPVRAEPLAIRRLDGTGVRAEASATVISYEGQATVLAVVRDVTELERARHRAAQREKLASLGEIAGGVAHQLRNPLGSINNAAYFLHAISRHEDDEAREALEIVSREVTSASEVVQTLLDLSRGGLDSAGSFEVADALRRAVESVAGDGAALELRIPAGLPPALGEPGVLSRAVRNVIEQALCSAPPGTRVEVSAAAVEGGVAISVHDDGPGLSDEAVRAVFEPFDATREHGIGLGLTVARMLVERLAGHFEVDSGPGRGTRFLITVPSCEAGAAAPGEPGRGEAEL